MFKPTSSKDRLNYGEILMPPIGYHVEKAIGTTYSLDLETLTAVAISMGLVADTDSELTKNPVCMLNALQKISDRITIFCECGQIKRPSKFNSLGILLEKMVVPVKLPYNDEMHGFPAFHPKTWLIEYANDAGEKQYRFVVMSRNLTFDHSWDIACALDGKVTNIKSQASEAIKEFLRFLKKNIDKRLSNSNRYEKDLWYFIKLVSNISFFLGQNGFTDFYVLPLGIGPKKYDMNNDELFKDKFHNLVVMSPFLSQSVIGKLNNDSQSLKDTKRTLITRRSELYAKNNKWASNFDVYVMKDKIIDGESEISADKNNMSDDNNTDNDDDDYTFKTQDIHAKIFLRQRDSDVLLYLGSMNASHAAINYNVEMVLKLKTKKKDYNCEKFLEDVMGKDPKSIKNPFEIVNLDDFVKESEETLQDKAEKIFKEISRLDMNANVESVEDNLYDIVINIGMEKNYDMVKIRPLLCKEEVGLSKTVKFNSLKLLQLSEFYVISVNIENNVFERVVVVPTQHMPQNRDTEVVRNVINDRKTFVEYISFVLGDDYVQSYFENGETSSSYGEWSDLSTMPAIYEKMLKTSLTDPNRLKEIKNITNMIDDKNIVPTEFNDMYKVFESAL